VSDYDGQATFYLSELSDHGCSSLYRFSDHIGETWRGRDDLRVTRTIRVDVTRLDTFMEREGIEHVHHLHIDAQGADLAVLRGLGSRYTDVDGGVLEVAARPEVTLYDGAPALHEVLDWLARHDFEVVRTDDQSGGNEVNVTFRRAT
jgi:hypothetical protein